MAFRAFFLVFVLLFTPQAWAASLRVRVATPEGAPIRDAVVTVHGARTPAGPIRFPWAMQVAQRNLQFDPFVLIAPAGADVAFPNFDTVRHHVYSFSPAGPFELRLYGHDETRSVHFANVGVIAIGCNIHDSMAAFIYVVDTPYAAKTDARGEAVITDLPAGAATVRLWHPYLRAADNAIERSVQLSGERELVETFEGQLHRPPVMNHTY
jgi:plastocyanin